MHNIVHLFRNDGFSQQEAYNKVGDLLNQRYRRWYIAHSELPLWGEEVDAQVQLYLKGCQDVILGNLNWRLVPLCYDPLKIGLLTFADSRYGSFKSERYFGKDNNTVRKTRLVTLVA